MEKIENKLSVRQSNELIEASYRLASIGEARLVRMLIAQIKPDDEDFKTYRISVADFASFFSISSNRAYEWVKKAADELAGRRIMLEKGKSWLRMNWLSSAEYVEGNGYVELCFDKKLKPYLLQLKGYYTQYQLDKIVHFKNIYAVRLFELLKSEQFKSDGNGYFRRSFEYEEIRIKLGVAEGEYPFFKDFRVRVIETAVKEINANPDITVLKVDYPKTGRKVSHIVFHCERARQTQLDLEEKIALEEVETKIKHPEYISELMAIGIDEKIAYRWKRKYTVARLRDAIAYTKAMQKAGKIRDSVAGFLARAVTDNIGGTWAEAQRKAELEKEQNEIAESERINKITRSQEEKKKYHDLLWKEFLELPEKEQDDFIRENVIKTPETMKTYLSKGKNSPMIRGITITTLANKKSNEQANS